jgi:hypothetical protein
MWTFIVSDFLMHCLDVRKKIILMRCCKVTMQTFLVMDFLLHFFGVSNKITALCCSIVTIFYRVAAHLAHLAEKRQLTSLQ